MQTGNNRNRPRLTKSHERVVAGVCGGIAAFFGWQPRVLRALWCLATLMTGMAPGFVAYLLFAMAMPPPPPRFNLDDFRVQ